MIELPAIYTDPDHLLAASPDELGMKMLIALKHRANGYPPRGPFYLANLLAELRQLNNQPPPPWTRLQHQQQAQVPLAISEAWSWLISEGLLVPSPTSNANYAWFVLSRRALNFHSEKAMADFAISRLLPRRMLHPRIIETSWSAFMRGEYDNAVLQAYKAVEVYVRDSAALKHDVFGTKLMRQAFHPETGPLSDMAADSGERMARADLFAGAIGSYKNPYSHRDVNLDDPAEAAEIVLLASHLLRIVDARRNARSVAEPDGKCLGDLK